jgi:hypothetical protein
MYPHPEKSIDPLIKSYKFNDLPERIRKKITVRGSKKVECWEWTGFTKQAKLRYRPYKVSDTYSGHRNFAGCHQADRALPQVHDPKYGGKVAAHRAIYSIITCTTINDVPALDRCVNPRCVSPYHVTVKGPSPNQVKGVVSKRDLVDVENKATSIPDKDPAVEVATAGTGMSFAEVCEKLIEHQPLVELGPGAAAEEYGLDLPLTEAAWPGYLSWRQNNPELLEDE